MFNAVKCFIEVCGQNYEGLPWLILPCRADPPVTASLLAWHEILRCSLPLLSVWSHPHRLGTVSVHFLCTFMSHPATNCLVPLLHILAPKYYLDTATPGTLCHTGESHNGHRRLGWSRSEAGTCAGLVNQQAMKDRMDMLIHV